MHLGSSFLVRRLLKRTAGHAGKTRSNKRKNSQSWEKSKTFDEGGTEAFQAVRTPPLICAVDVPFSHVYRGGKSFLQRFLDVTRVKTLS